MPELFQELKCHQCFQYIHGISACLGLAERLCKDEFIIITIVHLDRKEIPGETNTFESCKGKSELSAYQ